MSDRTPKTFTDKAGREWTLHIGLVALEWMRTAGVPLEDIVPLPGAKNTESSLVELSELLHGSVTAVRAAMALLQPTIDKLNLTREEFLEGIDDEGVMQAIGLALYEAIMDFFRKSPLRQGMVKQAWTRGAKMMQQAAKAMDRYSERMPEPTDETVETAINQEMDRQSHGKKSAGATPVSSGLNHHPK